MKKFGVEGLGEEGRAERADGLKEMAMAKGGQRDEGFKVEEMKLVVEEKEGRV